MRSACGGAYGPPSTEKLEHEAQRKLNGTLRVRLRAGNLAEGRRALLYVEPTATLILPLPGAIQEAGGTQFFEVRDPEGNVVEICEEP